MAHVSEPGFLVLHGLRLKGFAAAPVLAELTGLTGSDVEGVLGKLKADGFVQYREGRVTGWSLTPAGRGHHAECCEAEVRAAGCRDVFSAAYRRFLEINEPFLAVCTDWQLRAGPDGTRAINDHGDPGHDGAVVERLRGIDMAVRPICDDLGALLRRYQSYAQRLAQALGRVEAGEHEWFTGALIESYHTVWFELHEDLLATLGIARDQGTHA